MSPACIDTIRQLVRFSYLCNKQVKSVLHCERWWLGGVPGKPCLNGAMKNGKCRFHGGKATGAPKGNRNALKHGNYTAREMARRAAIKCWLRIAAEPTPGG